MAGPEVRLYADDGGVWRQRGAGERFGLAWDEIEWVRCSFRQGADGTPAVAVELYAKDGGIGLELGGPDRPADASELPAIAAALAARLGLPQSWYADLPASGRLRAPLAIWSRTAPPRVHADDRGLWCSELDLFTEWGRIAGIAARKARDGSVTIELQVADARDHDLHELGAASPGFSACARALAARLPGLSGDWTEALPGLAAGATLAVWRRSHPHGYPRLSADDLGVSREDAPGQASDLAWDDIDRVLAWPEDGRPGIELRSSDGVSLRLCSDWEGFGEVLAAMAAGLPDLTPARLARLDVLPTGQALWRRGWAVAAERAGPDGALETTWHRLDRGD